MPFMRRRALTISAALAGALAVPAAAQAATYTVGAGQGACGGADTACETLGQAAEAVGSGDSVEVAPGTYEGATFTDPGVTVKGPDVTPGAAPSVIVTGGMTFASGGASILASMSVVSTTAAPAVHAREGASLSVRDAILVSASGHGLQFDDGPSLGIERARILSGGGGTAAILSQSDTGSPAKTIAIDSSIIAGPGGGAGLRVHTKGLGTGDVTVTGRHVTVAGAGTALDLDASQATGLLSGAGSIDATLRDSIVAGSVRKAPNSGLLGIAANSVDVTLERTDTTTPPEQMFVDIARRDFNLRFDAPVRNLGEAAPADDRDVDGQVREQGQPTDLGADEYVNTAPVAKIAADQAQVRQNQPVTFSAAGSADREGPLKEYRWTFSDGSTQTTAAPSVTKGFADIGAQSASLVVVDAEGATSAASAVPVTVVDGVAPAVSVDTPRANQTLRIFRTTTRTVTRKGKKVRVKRRTRNRIAFRGRSLDASGVRQVVVTVRLITKARKPATKKKPAAKKSQSASTCHWLSPSRGFLRRSCRKPILITAKLDATAQDGAWTYTIPSRRKLSAGTYEVAALGVDKAGAAGNSVPERGKARFKLR